MVGRLPNEDGVWSKYIMHLGQAVAAGDFDDDGLCDLAASGVAPGHVFLYKGVDPMASIDGLSHSLPYGSERYRFRTRVR